MRKSGNNSNWTDTKQLETVIEYLTGNDSAREIGDRLSLTEGTMRRWVRKWRHDAEHAIKNGWQRLRWRLKILTPANPMTKNRRSNLKKPPPGCSGPAAASRRYPLPQQ